MSRWSDTLPNRFLLIERHSRLLQLVACRPSSCSGACPPNPAVGCCFSCLPQPERSVFHDFRVFTTKICHWNAWRLVLPGRLALWLSSRIYGLLWSPPWNVFAQLRAHFPAHGPASQSTIQDSFYDFEHNKCLGFLLGLKLNCLYQKNAWQPMWHVQCVLPNIQITLNVLKVFSIVIFCAYTVYLVYIWCEQYTYSGLQFLKLFFSALHRQVFCLI